MNALRLASRSLARIGGEEVRRAASYCHRGFARATSADRVFWLLTGLTIVSGILLIAGPAWFEWFDWALRANPMLGNMLSSIWSAVALGVVLWRLLLGYQEPVQDDIWLRQQGPRLARRMRWVIRQVDRLMLGVYVRGVSAGLWALSEETSALLGREQGGQFRRANGRPVVGIVEEIRLGLEGRGRLPLSEYVAFLIEPSLMTFVGNWGVWAVRGLGAWEGKLERIPDLDVALREAEEFGEQVLYQVEHTRARKAEGAAGTVGDLVIARYVSDTLTCAVNVIGGAVRTLERAGIDESGGHVTGIANGKASTTFQSGSPVNPEWYDANSETVRGKTLRTVHE